MLINKISRRKTQCRHKLSHPTSHPLSQALHSWGTERTAWERGYHKVVINLFQVMLCKNSS